MIPIKKIMKKDFPKLSPSESVGSAVKVMEKMNVDYLVVEEGGEIEGVVTSHELVGYPSSRLITDCGIQSIDIISEETLIDDAFKVLKGKKVNFLVILNKEGIPNGVLNREIIISFLYQELKKTYKELKQEITERKKAKEESQLFQNLINQSYDAVFVIDPETSLFLYANDKACSNLGYTREELLNMTFVDIEEAIPDNSSWKVYVEEAQKKGFVVLLGKHKRKDGTMFTVEVNAKPITYEKRDYLITVARDITEREQMEEVITRQLIEMERFNSELKSSKAFVSAILDSTIDAILTIDEKRVIQSVNKRTFDMFGYDENELLGINLGNILCETYRTEFEKNVSHHLKKKEGISIIHGIRALKKSGQEFDCEIAISEIDVSFSQKRPRFSVVIHDITERKQMEEELRQSEKLASIGQLAAGVAHELNNPTMGILNFAQYCLKHTQKDDKRYPVLEDIERETKRCIDIVQNLLTFSRLEKEVDKVYQKEAISVIFDRVLKLLSYRIEKSHVDVALDIPEVIPDIWMNANNMQQAILNLITNALDAVEEKKNRRIQIGTQLGGAFVHVTIADNGSGIPPEVLPKIFDPFFTTKPAGKGTGMGLSISHGIIANHGGKMTCESKFGEGTEFKILLPIKRGDEYE